MTPTEATGHLELIESYFEAIRAHDADALASLFSPDAELLTAAGTFRGPEAIGGFYRDLAFQIADLRPDPGPFVVDGNRVAVEIRLRMNGTVSLAGDFFTLGDGMITRLAIYAGPPEG